jgi:hypothetical protein
MTEETGRRHGVEGTVLGVKESLVELEVGRGVLWYSLKPSRGEDAGSCTLQAASRSRHR